MFIAMLMMAIGLSLVLGCKPKSASMPVTLKTWERTRFEPGGGNAMVCFVIYGRFTNDAQVSGSAYRTQGLPHGVELRHFTQEQDSFPLVSGAVEELLHAKNPELLAKIKEAPECLILQGEVVDQPNLDYLRDCVGLVTFYMDHGGIVVADVQQLKFMERAEWRREFFEPEQPKIGRHVVILFSEEPVGTGMWFHTRGLRKFGRPDLSLHNVTDMYREGAIDLCNRFIELQAQGGRILEGQEIRMKSLPAGLVCRHRGSMDDPDFNNVHVEIQFPKAQ